jgi:protein TonB
MPAYVLHRRTVRTRERATALVAVAAVQLALAFGLLSGFQVDIARSSDIVSQLIEVSLPRPPVPPPPPEPPKSAPVHHASSAPKAEPKPLGGSPGPEPAHAPLSIAPVVAVRPLAAPSGGGVGAGPAIGTGTGGGAGGNGYGDSDGGGTDLEQIAGEITPRDYPRHLREAGVGGTVGILFTVGVNGRVIRCTVTRSSGVPELDALTCRLIQQRFIYRPSTDRNGRPVSDEVEGEHQWEVGRR